MYAGLVFSGMWSTELFILMISAETMSTNLRVGYMRMQRRRVELAIERLSTVEGNSPLDVDEIEDSLRHEIEAEKAGFVR